MSSIDDEANLENTFYEGVEPNSAFSRAQLYKSNNATDKAIEWYKKVLTLENCNEEKYVSCFEIFDLYEKQNKSEFGIHYLTESMQYDNERIECHYRLICYYCSQQKNEEAYAYYKEIESYYQKYIDLDLDFENENEKLCLKKYEYDFYLPYYMIIVTCNLGKHDLSPYFFEIIFRKKVITTNWHTNSFYHNAVFSISFLPKKIEYLQHLLDYFHLVQKEGLEIELKHHKTIETIIDQYRDLLIERPTALPDVSDRQNINIIMSFTTCKRLDLFTKTMNSIIRTWKDLHLVDYFYCVDDNSSKEDRDAMQELYPFFNFYFKNEKEKGHRKSMNIIWNKLQEIKPTYWIHLEDDWLYFHPRNYISNTLEFLTQVKDQNIHQVVFNRNYGLFFSDMDRVGGIQLTPDFILHEKKDGLVGRNCGYWPHYSLQPSICITETILSLGNYDSLNSFFERDFANKYFERGYKTAFFPAIYSIHIGKQHWETDGKNAYALNNESQFANKYVELPFANTITSLPLIGTMHQHLDSILQKLANLTPFALIRPSDGEHGILRGNTFKNCDSWTFTSGGILQQQLLEAIQTKNPSLYIGIPCNTCNKPWNCTQTIYNDFIQEFNIPFNQRTFANIFMNSNWETFVSFISTFQPGFHYIGSGTFSGNLPIQERLVIDSYLVDTWDSQHNEETKKVIDFIEKTQDSSKVQVYCFSAGPLSKIWIPKCFSAYPNNIYIDVGSSLDYFTKKQTTRPYMIENHSFKKEACFFREEKNNQRNLVYMCVFFNKDYIKLLHLLLTSLKVYSRITFDILIITQDSFYKDIATLSATLDIPLFIHCIPNCDTIFQAACARLRIFDYPSISEYAKIFYLDTDILIKKDLSPLFEEELDEVVYVISEGTIGEPNLGKDFFDFTKFSPSLPGVNSGTLLFKNTEKIKELFTKILTHIQTHVAASLPIPACADQPFISYNLINESMYNNTLLPPFISLYGAEENMVTNDDTSIICHFSFPIGNFSHKYHRMKDFFKTLLNTEEPLVLKKDACTCDVKQGFCHLCNLSRNNILSWESNQVTFNKNFLHTKWGSGSYKYIHYNVIEATWCRCDHIIILQSDTFFSIRTNPLDFEVVRGKRVC